MLAKLTFRNLRRQISSYIIYFLTVIIAVAMMFAVNNILFSADLFNYVQGWAQPIVRSILIMVVVIVTVVVCVIISYATAFLLRKRKKEFGTYLLLGIKREDIMRMFVAENVIIGAFSFVCGCLLGLGVFGALNSIVSALMDNVLPPTAISPASFVLTLVQWAIIMACALIYCSSVLARTKINNLIAEKNTVILRLKRPRIERTLAIIAFCGICFGAIFLVLMLYRSLHGGNSSFLVAAIPTTSIILFVSIFMFYVCLRSVYVHRLTYRQEGPSRDVRAERPERAAVSPSAPVTPLEYRPRAYKRGNIFHLRQMSHAMNSNAVMTGLIAVLLSVAIIAVNIAFLLRELSLSDIDCRFDVCSSWSFNESAIGSSNNVSSPEEIIDDARQYSEIDFLRVFYVYNNDKMKISDYNALAAELGEEQISLAENEFYYIGDRLSVGDTFTWYDEMVCAGSTGEDKFQGNAVLNAFNIGYGIYVAYLVPDSVIREDASKTYEILTMNTKEHLPLAFNNKYAYTQVRNRFWEMDSVNSQYAVVIIAAIFLGVTFMLLAMALLSVKALSDADADRRRYGILNMLGVSAGRQRRILLKQQFAFLAAPLVIPLLLTAPLIGAGAIISDFMLGAVSPIVFAVGFAVPLLYAAIYAAYFAATYYLSVKSCIRPLEKNRVRILPLKNEKGADT